MKRTGNEIIEYILNDLGIKAPTFAAMINVGYPRIHVISDPQNRQLKVDKAILTEFVTFLKYKK